MTKKTTKSKAATKTVEAAAETIKETMETVNSFYPAEVSEFFTKVTEFQIRSAEKMQKTATKNWYLFEQCIPSDLTSAVSTTYTFKAATELLSNNTQLAQDLSKDYQETFFKF